MAKLYYGNSECSIEGSDVRGVQISYKGGGSTVVPTYGVNGGATTSAFTATSLTDASTTSWTHITLTPDSPINNVYSFQLKLVGTATATFEVNDISIVYRLKGIK